MTSAKNREKYFIVVCLFFSPVVGLRYANPTFIIGNPVSLFFLLSLSVILDIFNRGSSVFAFPSVRKNKDSGFPRARE